MTRAFLPLFALGAALVLPGCAAKTAFDLATTPVRNTRDTINAAGKAYDLATTSQSEADEKRGRTLRKNRERLVRLEREYRNQSEDCADGDRDACEDRYDTWAEMQQVRQYIPAATY